MFIYIRAQIACLKILKKQMKYAADLNVNYVLMAGEEERHQGVWTVRHMESGDQQKVSEQEAIAMIQAGL